ncbi:MAG: TonB-dependent receptor, partial [Calditrichia bacterium]|nr:TonB-dependent receptor [Calditrichia bacterium]
MNTAIFRSGNLHNVISFDPFSIEKTEILFGPGSVIYGSDAIGGAMSFFTHTPILSTENGNGFRFNATTRISSANFEKTGHFDINIGWENWAIISSATYTDYDNLKMGSIGPSDYLRSHYVTTISGKDSIVSNNNPKEQLFTEYNQLNLMQKIRFKPNDFWEFNYGLHYSKSSNIPRYDRLIELSDNNLKNAEWYYGPQIWMMNLLNAQYSFSNIFFNKAKLTLAQQYFKESRHDRNFDDNHLRHRTETLGATSLNIDFNKRICQNHNVFYGLELVLNDVGSEAETENTKSGLKQPIGTRYPNDSKWNSYASYLNYHSKLKNKITLQSGLRYNFISLKSEFDNNFYPFPFSKIDLNSGALTGSLGLIYWPNENFEIKMNLSTGFRAPNIDDISKVFDSEPGSVVVPNPNLKSEYAYNIDLGLIKTFAEFARIDITGFYTFLDNAMIKQSFIFNGLDSIKYDGTLSKVKAIQNSAKAYVYGLQAGIELKLPGHFSFLTRLNYQKGKEERDNGDTFPLRHAAPLFGSAHVFYKNNQLKFDFSAIYNDKITFDNLAPFEQNKPHIYASDKNGNPYSPEWFTLNLKIFYQFNYSISLTIGVENIFDKRYRPYSSGVTAPGRNFITALSVSL